MNARFRLRPRHAGFAAALLLAASTLSCYNKDMDNKKPLTPEEEEVIVRKGTEAPFTGRYWNHFAAGVYRCRRCDAVLYRSDDKFDAGCGWPAFDTEIPGAVLRRPDADGVRTEIVCAGCGGHLGHVFTGEGHTDKNTRHCVNSISMVFEPAPAAGETAIFAAGCFWGVQHRFTEAPGVVSARAGYTGGTLEHPTYEQVCTGRTGHYEAVEVVFDPAQTTYRALLQLFFELHDFSRADGQGPDIGPQYRSAVFYRSPAQKENAEAVIALLKSKGHRVATQILPAAEFWPAEDYHQDYYRKKGVAPTCNIPRRLF